MLTKTPININFSAGLDTKSDPYQVGPTSFLSLVNSVFTTTGRLTKRNGFKQLTSLPTSASSITTFKNNLVALGSQLQVFNSDSSQWVSTGAVQSVTNNVTPLIRSSTGQSSADVAIASNGLGCSVWLDTDGNHYYSVVDSSTGQIIVPKVALEATANSARVFSLPFYFVITYIATVSSNPALRFLSIPISNPVAVPTPVTFTASTPSALTAAYDGAVGNGVLYLAYASTSNAIKIASLNSNLSQGFTATVSSHTATYLSVTVDSASNIVWVSYWDNSSTNGYTQAFSNILGSILSPTEFIIGKSLNGLTTSAYNGVMSFYYEVLNTYSYSSTKTDFVNTGTVTQVGSVSSTTVLKRGVGLASKAFYLPYTGKNYVLLCYGQTYQPTYFLVDNSGNIISKLAYSNGGGYATTQILPQVSVNGSLIQFAYLYADLLVSVSKTQTTTPIPGLYSQTGINLANINFNSPQRSLEIANDLHLTGGFMAMYDGTTPVEHQFHVWPEDVVVSPSTTSGSMAPTTYYYQVTYEWTDAAGNIHRSAPSIPYVYTILTAPTSFTANRTSGSATLAAVSSFTNLQVGQAISGTGIPANTFIVSLNPGASTLVMSNNASSGSATNTTITPTSVTSATVNVPYLRLTAKTSVRIVVYRWSTNQQNYFQISSVTSPTINVANGGSDSVAITDTYSDAQITGNTLIYTTGGVLEDIAAPGTNIFTLWQSRLFTLDAEDQNTIWFSKQVIEAVPVEMSDLLTLYIAPTTGAQGSTGPITALSSMDDKLIIFKSDAIYYINGLGPDNTGSNGTFSDPIFITGTVGCANPSSIVLLPTGLMFQSDKGIWLLGRDLSTNYIGAPVEKYNSNTVLSGTAIPGTNQVRFLLNNSITLVYDYYFNQWSTHTNILATFATLYQSSYTYINSLSQIYQEAAGTYLDGSSPVLMSLTTAWMSLAGLQGYERFYFGYLLGTYYTPFTLSMQIAYDYNSSATQAITITPDNYANPWGGEANWGSGSNWGGNTDGNVFTARFFPQTQKCSTFQISLQEIYDSTRGPNSGQGLTLSGMNLVVGVKRGYRTQKAAKSFG